MPIDAYLYLVMGSDLYQANNKNAAILGAWRCDER